MNRIVKIELAGKAFPLNFSIQATKELMGRYGSFEGMQKALDSSDAAKTIGEVCWIVSVLMEQGTAYQRLLEGKAEPALSLEELEVICGLSDMPKLQQAIMDCMGGGFHREVETEDTPKKGRATRAK